jgi:hypothetical protein
MGDLGDDIKDAHADVGSSYIRIRPGVSNASGEYCVTKLNRQATKPFVREFFQEGAFDWDTEARAGDVIQLATTGWRFLIPNLTPKVFADELIEYSSVLYKCNVSGQIWRPTEVDGVWDSNYRMQGGFSLVAQDVFALQTESLYGNDLESDNELNTLIGLQDHELYVSAGYGIQVFDRYEPRSGEYYKIETIKKRRYDNVWVCQITEDTR